MRSTTRKIKDNSGTSTLIWGMFLIVVIIFLFMMIFEKYRLHMVIDDLSKDITSTLTTTASSNIYNSYATIRDATSGTFVFDGIDFTEIKETAKFRNKFVEVYSSCKLEGGDIVKYQNGVPIFRISNISLYVSNAGNTGKRSSYICEYDLTIYLDLLWKDETVNLTDQHQTVKYINKF